MQIGVWRRTADGSRYEREVDGRPHWAAVPGFARATDRPRVLLLGESVARGELYDPVVNPAGMIEQQFAAAQTAVEVVDLAKLGATFQDILDVAEPARDLDPNAVVVFAGNNWKYEILENATGDQLTGDALALEQGGIGGLLRRREAALAAVTEAFVGRVCQLYAGVAPVLFVLPESNLLDWHPAELTPVLGDGREIDWYRALHRARAAAARADWDTVESSCAEMSELDQGTGDAAHRLRARALLARGRVDEALAEFRRARDVRLWCDGIDPSWLPSAGLVAARTAAHEAGAAVLDLAEILPRHAASGIPDRSLFADYCHLNGTGLAIASAQIAAAVAPLLGLAVTVGNADLPVTPASAEAAAAFSAAFLHADFAQPEESMRALARTAAHADPRITTAMAAYCAAPAAPVPWWMRKLDVSGFPTAQEFLDRLGRTNRYLYDAALVTAFSEQVETGAVGQRAGALRPGVRTQLLDPMYAPGWRPVEWDGVIGTLPGRPTGFRHFYRARDDRSAFTLPLGEPAAVEFELVLRLGTPGSGTAHVLINGHDLGRAPLSERWHTHRFRAPAELLVRGHNELTIYWRRTAIATTPISVLAQRLARGLGQELSVVYGEAHSIVAVPAGLVRTDAP